MAITRGSVESRRPDEKETIEHIGNVQDSGDSTPDVVPSAYYTSWQFLGSYLAIIFTSIALYVSYIMPVSVLAVINLEIGPSTSTSIIPLLHALIKGVMLLLVGHFSDIFGRRWVLISGQLLCAVGSIPCALSKDVNTLIGGTVMVALGGGVQPLYPLLCQEVVPNKYRGASQAFLTVLILPFMGFGGLLARLLVNNTTLGWRWIYWMNLIFCFASVVLYYICYRPPKFHEINQDKSKLEQLKELDYLGLGLYSGGAIMLTLGFVWSTDATVGGWSSARVIGLIVGGGVALIAFGFWEVFAPLKTPLVPLHLFSLKGFIPIIAVGVVAHMGFYSFNLFVPQITQLLYTTDNIKLGLMSSIANTGLAVGEIIVGFVWKYVKHNKLQTVLATFSLVLFTGLMALVNQYRMGWVIADIALAGMCIGWIQLLALLNVGLIVPVNDIGTAQGFFGSCRNIAGTIATSIFLSIYGVRSTQTIQANVPAAVTEAGLPASSLPALFAAMKTATAAALQAVPGMTSNVLAVFNGALKDSYSQSFQTMYLASIAFGVCACVAAFLVRDVDHLMTSALNKRVDGTGNTAAGQQDLELQHGVEKSGSRV